ncbi:MAG: ribosome-binding factor A [Labilithrix sp.]|nr:ribosome-binding factor A [Labilithrix sp.]
MRREEEGAGYRHPRVQGLIFEELRALMRDDVSDPALTDVRITAVVLSVDYRHARVHFALAARAERRRSAESALVRVTPFLRARLADAVEMKRIPDLRFVFDGVAIANDGAFDDDGGVPCSG